MTDEVTLKMVQGRERVRAASYNGSENERQKQHVGLEKTICE